jgi:hypothetical protein
MSIRKSALISTALGLLALPVIASANLETYNWTNEPSTVKIISSGMCSSTFGKVTPPINHATGAPGYLSTSALEVRFICGHSTGACAADVYASANCTGIRVATLAIDLTSLAVKMDPSTLDPRYKIFIAGSRVDIKPVA